MDIILDDDHIQYFQDEIFLLDKSIQEMLMENKFDSFLLFQKTMDLIFDENIEYIQDEIFLLDKSIQEMLIENPFQQEIENPFEQEIKSEKDCFECGICYDQIQDNNVVYLKKCNHKFCQKCIKRVRHRKFQTPCPYCRTLFIKSDIKPLFWRLLLK